AIGVPTDRGSLLLLILAGLGITCIGRGPRAFGRVLLDWLPFTATLVIWDVSRGIADAVGLPLHVSDVAAADRWLFFGTVPTVWLQDHFFDPGSPHWYDAAATLVYTTHFLATPILAAVWWLRNRDVWLAFVRRVLALAVAGLITYVLFPAAPPWYAAREGAIDPVVRGSSRGWLWLHVNKAGNLLREGQVAANPVAAMPSLHTAYATIIALFVIANLRTRLRWLVVLYPVAMGLALVYLGEHYVVDVVAGVIYALAVHVLIGRWEHRRADRREQRAAAVRPGPDDVDLGNSQYTEPTRPTPATRRL
ncbi:MAG: Phosphoesterase, PA-phosphatase related, partial [Pseudonocardiales bacterium]|nr:Phosphoesterase, PA-phosphatase related [Pseudonocardiales bacterium]